MISNNYSYSSSGKDLKKFTCFDMPFLTDYILPIDNILAMLNFW